MQVLLDLVQRHHAGQPLGIYSVCSAHPLVIEAAFDTGLAGNLPVLIEATSNQVNQDGGYTGMTPGAFRDFVHGIARKAGFPPERVLLGGDHLGPNCWQGEAAEAAMARSEVLIDQYVTAGFRKIHLDCSMSCAGDPLPLPDEVVAERAARLAVVAERAWQRAGAGEEAPVYIVGTEVPVPGGAHEDLDQLAVTTPQAAAVTIAAHRAAFAAAGLQDTWPRVIGLVVQPGVEFDHHKVIDYRPQAARELSRFIEDQPGMVFEAHSTDYQTTASLAALVRDHFAILKVGPGLTFALRETLWALADIEAELEPEAGADGPRFKEVVLETMRAEPGYWRKYYHGDGAASLRFDQQFSLSDRIRYYWPHPAIQAAQAALLERLARRGIPLTLLSQYLPAHYEAVREGRLRNAPADLLKEGVARVLRQYMQACAAGTHTEEQ